MTTPKALPLWFGPPDRSLFAWYHAPAEGRARAAVVLCKPIGYEMLCSDRAYRHLALRLADAGFAVLRFDYDGTGNSAGDDSEPERVAAWTRSIALAIGEVRARSGCAAVSLFGTRIGGSLAALAAAESGQVDHLVLLAPCITGKSYTRELRAFRRLGNSEVAPAEGGDEEAAGFLLSESTIAELSKVRLTKIAPKVKSALVITRDDLVNNEESLVASFEAQGIRAELAKDPGYAAMMQNDPYKSEVPVGIWTHVADWLVALYPEVAAHTGTDPADELRNEAVHAVDVREKLVEFGPGRDLFGVITDNPASVTTKGKPRPAILFVNTGANPHIGTSRMYVKMAREWAREGFTVLRWDLAGFGDSKGSSENQIYSSTAVDETRSAMDFLERTYGIDRFVLIGLCSGAYVSFNTGVVDARVAGIVLINLLTFHWKPGDSLEVKMRTGVKATRYYWQVALEPQVWRRVARGDVNIRIIGRELSSRVLARTRGAVSNAWGRLMRGQHVENDVAAKFRSMCARGTDVLVILGSEDGAVDTLEEQLGPLGRKMKGHENFHVEVIEGSDHTFTTPRSSQSHLSLLIRNHLAVRFP